MSGPPNTAVSLNIIKFHAHVMGCFLDENISIANFRKASGSRVFKSSRIKAEHFHFYRVSEVGARAI